MTPRILSMRLRDLRKEGLVERRVGPRNPREIRYRLTAQGRDVIPILTALIQYGIRHHADRVFEDREPRALGDVFPGQQDRMLGGLASFAEEARSDEGRKEAR